ncbi:MAG: carbohydrate ABC transporter permease [Vallitalea sp.]|jgi:raffinose/stachyose/melibiose transport system permease protein|nr:carbohydrate ABC transporter permease [Vallitalea sp.]
MNKTKRMDIIRKLFIVVFIIIYLVPLYVALVNAFKSYEDIVKSPLSLPRAFNLDNFRLAFERTNVLQLYSNSIIITLGSLAILIITSAMLAYVIARRNKKIYKFLFLFILAGMMVPQQMVLIPSIKTLKVLGLLHSLPGMLLFYGGTYMSLGFFLYVQFIKTIPISLEEAATIDGASQYRIFFKIIFPLLKPCTATVSIFLGMWIWNDFLPPMYILGSNNGRTITTGIYSAIGRFTTDWNIVFAFVILASLPIIITYLLMQKQFMRGLTAGSVKG